MGISHSAIRFDASRAATIPPAGKVDFFFDHESQTMVWIDADGVKHQTGGSGDIDAAIIENALGYVPVDGGVETSEIFNRRANGFTFTHNSTMPIVGTRPWRFVNSGGSNPPIIETGALRAGNSTLMYFGQTGLPYIRNLNFDFTIKPSDRSQANKNGYTVAFAPNELITSGGTIALQVGMIHATVNSAGPSLGICTSVSPLNFDGITADGESTSTPSWNGRTLGGNISFNTRHRQTWKIEQGKITLSCAGKTRVYRDARIATNYTSFWVETGAPQGYNDYWLTHCISVNNDVESEGIIATTEGGLSEASTLVSNFNIRPKFLGEINTDIVGDMPVAGVSSAAFGGAVITNNILSRVYTHSEGPFTMSMPRKNTGIGYGIGVVPVTYLSISAPLASAAGGVEASVFGKYFAIGLSPGDSERFEWGGVFAANANTKRIRLRIGNSTFPAGFDSGNLTENGTSWKLIVTRQCLTGDAFRISWEFWSGTTYKGMAFTTVASGAEVLVDHYLMFTGTAASDVVAYTLNAMLRQNPF